MDPSSGEDQAWLKVMEVATLSLVPMALKAAIQLNVIGILAEHAEQLDEPFLTPAQITSQFVVAPSSSNPPFDHERASTSLDRTLRVLASHGLLSSSLLINPPPQPPTRTYGLNSCSRYLLQTKGQGSMAPLVLLIQDPIVAQCFFHFQDAILHGLLPFTQANGMQSYSYARQDPRFHGVFHRAMEAQSKLFIQTLLDSYNGFEDITSLVDVGGGVSACLAKIISKHTHIKGINLDLPYVVASAPEYPGVNHVGGDMFEEIPKADAVFIKWVLHNWSDAQCLTIMKNCYKALPNKGKVIVVDAILPNEVDCELHARAKYQMDLLMLACLEGGKERTKQELDDLSKASGFTKMQVICSMGGCSVMEIYKDVA